MFRTRHPFPASLLSRRSPMTAVGAIAASSPSSLSLLCLPFLFPSSSHHQEHLCSRTVFQRQHFTSTFPVQGSSSSSRFQSSKKRQLQKTEARKKWNAQQQDVVSRIDSKELDELEKVITQEDNKEVEGKDEGGNSRVDTATPPASKITTPLEKEGIEEGGDEGKDSHRIRQEEVPVQRKNRVDSTTPALPSMVAWDWFRAKDAPSMLSAILKEGSKSEDKGRIVISYQHDVVKKEEGEEVQNDTRMVKCSLYIKKEEKGGKEECRHTNERNLVTSHCYASSTYNKHDAQCVCASRALKAIFRADNVQNAIWSCINSGQVRSPESVSSNLESHALHLGSPKQSMPSSADLSSTSHQRFQRKTTIATPSFPDAVEETSGELRGKLNETSFFVPLTAGDTPRHLCKRRTGDEDSATQSVYLGLLPSTYTKSTVVFLVNVLLGVDEKEAGAGGTSSVVLDCNIFHSASFRDGAWAEVKLQPQHQKELLEKFPVGGTTVLIESAGMWVPHVRRQQLDEAESNLLDRIVRSSSKVMFMSKLVIRNEMPQPHPQQQLTDTKPNGPVKISLAPNGGMGTIPDNEPVQLMYKQTPPLQLLETLLTVTHPTSKLSVGYRYNEVDRVWAAFFLLHPKDVTMTEEQIFQPDCQQKYLLSQGHFSKKFTSARLAAIRAISKLYGNRADVQQFFKLVDWEGEGAAFLKSVNLKWRESLLGELWSRSVLEHVFKFTTRDFTTNGKELLLKNQPILVVGPSGTGRRDAASYVGSYDEIYGLKFLSSSSSSSTAINSTNISALSKLRNLLNKILSDELGLRIREVIKVRRRVSNDDDVNTTTGTNRVDVALEADVVKANTASSSRVKIIEVLDATDEFSALWDAYTQLVANPFTDYMDMINKDRAKNKELESLRFLSIKTACERIRDEGARLLKEELNNAEIAEITENLKRISIESKNNNTTPSSSVKEAQSSLAKWIEQRYGAQVILNYFGSGPMQSKQEFTAGLWLMDKSTFTEGGSIAGVIDMLRSPQSSSNPYFLAKGQGASLEEAIMTAIRHVISLVKVSDSREAVSADDQIPPDFRRAARQQSATVFDVFPRSFETIMAAPTTNPSSGKASENGKQKKPIITGDSNAAVIMPFEGITLYKIHCTQQKEKEKEDSAELTPLTLWYQLEQCLLEETKSKEAVLYAAAPSADGMASWKITVALTKDNVDILHQSSSSWSPFLAMLSVYQKILGARMEKVMNSFFDSFLTQKTAGAIKPPDGKKDSLLFAPLSTTTHPERALHKIFLLMFGTAAHFCSTTGEKTPQVCAEGRFAGQSIPLLPLSQQDSQQLHNLTYTCTTQSGLYTRLLQVYAPTLIPEMELHPQWRKHSLTTVFEYKDKTPKGPASTTTAGAEEKGGKGASKKLFPSNANYGNDYTTKEEYEKDGANARTLEDLLRVCVRSDGGRLRIEKREFPGGCVVRLHFVPLDKETFEPELSEEQEIGIAKGNELQKTKNQAIYLTLKKKYPKWLKTAVKENSALLANIL